MGRPGYFDDVAYYMALLDDGGGRQHICFSTSEYSAQRGIYYNERGHFDLSVPFAAFSLAVERVLEGNIGGRIMLDGSGSFMRIDNDVVEFTTSCGMRFTIDRAALEDLAS